LPEELGPELELTSLICLEGGVVPWKLLSRFAQKGLDRVCEMKSRTDFALLACLRRALTPWNDPRVETLSDPTTDPTSTPTNPDVFFDYVPSSATSLLTRGPPNPRHPPDEESLEERLS